MIHGGQFYDKPLNTDNIIDALWCQTASNDSHVGMWFFPNGSLVATVDTFANPGTEPVFSIRSIGQIALARDDSLNGYEGLYTCIIPDESGINQTLVVGIYRTQIMMRTVSYNIIIMIVMLFAQMVLMQIPLCSSLSSPQEILTLQSSLSPSMSLMDLQLMSLVQMKVTHLQLLVVICLVWWLMDQDLLHR